jgi:hypothetical protein
LSVVAFSETSQNGLHMPLMHARVWLNNPVSKCMIVSYLFKVISALSFVVSFSGHSNSQFYTLLEPTIAKLGGTIIKA